MSGVMWLGLSSLAVLWLTVAMHMDYRRLRAEIKSPAYALHLHHMLMAVRFMYLLLALDVGMLIQAGYRVLRP